MPIATIEFESYEKSVPEVMDQAGAPDVIDVSRPVLLKPNCINTSAPPITTSPDLCEAVVLYLRSLGVQNIVIAEGAGDMVLETGEIFESLGYVALSRRLDVPLIDLNSASLIRLEKPECRVFPEMYLPEILFTHTVISLPALKRHSLAGVTLAMKNMIGVAPPEHYSGRHGSWKKAVFHGDMHQSIRDLNAYRAPDFSLIDATRGMAEFHLGGAELSPPPNKLMAGANAKELDREACALLHVDWRNIPHLR